MFDPIQMSCVQLGRASIYLNRTFDIESGGLLVFSGLVVTLLMLMKMYGVLSFRMPYITFMENLMNVKDSSSGSDLCSVSRDGGNVKTVEQNRCNQTTNGTDMATDWACRNDGYSGYVVTSA
jgi:hypothetical protein